MAAVVISLKLVYTPVDDNVTAPHKSQVTRRAWRSRRSRIGIMNSAELFDLLADEVDLES